MLADRRQQCHQTQGGHLCCKWEGGCGTGMCGGCVGLAAGLRGEAGGGAPANTPTTGPCPLSSRLSHPHGTPLWRGAPESPGARMPLCGWEALAGWDGNGTGKRGGEAQMRQIWRQVRMLRPHAVSTGDRRTSREVGVAAGFLGYFYADFRPLSFTARHGEHTLSSLRIPPLSAGRVFGLCGHVIIRG